MGAQQVLLISLNIVERIDARQPISTKQGAIVTHGQQVKAMIINGLGFTQNPIYLSHHFFENKALSVFFGEGIRHEYFNDDALARTLDVTIPMVPLNCLLKLPMK